MNRSDAPHVNPLLADQVEWRAWGDQAFQEAVELGRPVFLSIGRSNCPLCQKMTRDSFRDTAVVEMINREFIPIAVDQAERPDVAQVYLTYVQAVTGKMGWPLTVWLTPELNPFYGGAYFSLTDGAAGPGLKTVLESICAGWKSDPIPVIEEGKRVRANLVKHKETIPLGEAVPDLIDPGGNAFEKCYSYLFENFDAQDGGFGGAPKFPRWSMLGFSLRCGVLQGLHSETGREAMDMVSQTLLSINRSALYDQVDGGVFHYAIDDSWKLPYFEKRLGDQAQFALILLETDGRGRDIRFQESAKLVLDYAIDQLRYEGRTAFVSSQGGLIHKTETNSANPGDYFMWAKAEIDELLAGDAPEFCNFFEVTKSGNIPEKIDPELRYRGMNVLRQKVSMDRFVDENSSGISGVSQRLIDGLRALHRRRRSRVSPLKAARIFVNENGLFLGALARASALFSNKSPSDADRYIKTSMGIAETILAHLWGEPAVRLSHSFGQGAASQIGFAEDYAAFIHGLIELYDATFCPRWLRIACEIQQVMDERFWDSVGGGYFQSAEGDSSIIFRTKDCFDGAVPSANSIAALNLFRLGALLNDGKLRRRGLDVLQAFRESWEQTPWNHAYLLTALEWALTEPKRVLLRKSKAEANWSSMRSELGQRGRAPFVTIELEALEEDAEFRARFSVPDLGLMTNDRTAAHVFSRDALVGVAQSTDELRILLGPDSARD